MSRRLERVHPAHVALAAALAILALAACGPIFDSDVWWHLRNGETVLDARSIPSTNSYSWIAPGKDWILDEWAFDVGLALVQRAGGLVGLALFRSVAIVLVGLSMAMLCRRAGAGPWPTTVASVTGVLVLFVFIVERPWTVSLVLLPLAVVATRATFDGSRRAFVAAVVLVAAWANLHLAVVAGLGVMVAIAVGRAVEDRDLWRRAVGFTAASAGAALVNPYGVRAYQHVFHARNESVGVRDWEHLNPFTFPDFHIAVFAAAIAGALLLTGRWRQPSVALPLALLAVLTADALRNGPFLVVLGAAEIALALEQRSTIVIPRRRSTTIAAGIAVVALLAVGLVHAVTTAGDVRASDYPISARERLPAGCRLFNEYTFGGFVEWFRPDVPVSVDGRNDFYGIDVVNEQIAVLSNHPDAATSMQWLDDHAVDCVLLPQTSALVATLRDDANWQLATVDPSGVLFVRNPARTAE